MRLERVSPNADCPPPQPGGWCVPTNSDLEQAGEAVPGGQGRPQGTPPPPRGCPNWDSWRTLQLAERCCPMICWASDSVLVTAGHPTFAFHGSFSLQRSHLLPSSSCVVLLPAHGSHGLCWPDMQSNCPVFMMTPQLPGHVVVLELPSALVPGCDSA